MRTRSPRSRLLYSHLAYGVVYRADSSGSGSSCSRILSDRRCSDPDLNGKRGAENGRIYRDSFGKLNTVVLDNLYGLDEILQYGQQENV